jgi:hypothetical protein
MLKNITRKGAWLGAAALIVMAAAPAQAANDDPTGAEADASALTATGSIVGENGLDLNSDACVAKLPGGKADGVGVCGNGLDTNANVDAFSQNASANKSGTSAATASVSPIDLQNLTSVDLTDVIENGLAGLSTGTVLDTLLGPLAQALANIGVQLGDLFDQLDGVLDQVTSPIDDALPLSVQIGAVESECTATADTRDGHEHANDSQDHADGDSTVASVNLVLTLGGQDIVVPMTGPNAADTPPNTNLLVGAPQDLVDAILDTLKDTLTQSLGGALSAAVQLIVPIQDVVDQLLEALEPTLLQGVADALAPLIKGTVNEQNPVSPVDGEDAEIDVAALDLTLLDGLGDQLRQQLKLARVHCGPNDPIDDNGGNGKTDFQVLKTEKVKGDNKIEWTIKVRNPKSEDAHDVVVKDFYPKAVKGDVKIEEGPSTGTFDEDTGIWKIPTLGGKKVATLVIKAKVSKKKLDDGINNVACAVTKNGALTSAGGDKPDKIQKNDSFEDDTDGCDSSGSKKKKDDKDDDTPKKIDSGVSNGGNLGALAATGLLAVAALGGTAVRQRLLLNR